MGFALGHQEKTRQSSEWRHWGWSFARPGRRPELLSRPEASTPSGNEMSWSHGRLVVTLLFVRFQMEKVSFERLTVMCQPLARVRFTAVFGI